MTSTPTPRLPDIKAADFAEYTVLPDYRRAVNVAYYRDQDGYPDRLITSKDILWNSVTKIRERREQGFEARRLAILTEMDGTQLGAFHDYFNRIPAQSRPSGLTKEDLEIGEPGIVSTNSRIMALEQQIDDDPLQFFEAALNMIKDRNLPNTTNVGPENYATALYYFRGKFNNVAEKEDIDLATINEKVDQCLAGFLGVAKSDPPNFVELGNIFLSIRDLPAGSASQKFTKPLLRHCFEQLPTFNQQTIDIVLGGMTKLNYEGSSDYGPSLADMLLRKSDPFERTSDLLRALKLISCLPKSPATDNTFRTFYIMRNKLEDPLDLKGMEQATRLLLKIVEEVFENIDLALLAKEIAGNCAHRANEIFLQQNYRGVNKQHPEKRKATESAVRRIKATYEAI